MPRVAIVGSCITRDVWRFRGADADGLLYISRTSLPSLLSRPVDGFTPSATPPNGLRPQPHRAVVADLEKSALRRLLDFRPSHLIFDFIDERFDLISTGGGAIVTRSAELEQSGYLDQTAFAGARTIPRLSTACRLLWEDAAREFAALVRATPLSDACLILHGARWAQQSRDANGRLRPLSDVEIMAGEQASIAEHNRLLADYEAAFTGLMPPMTRIEAPGHRVADRDHQWGLSPFHYAPQYYEEIARQMETLGIAMSS